MIGKKALQKLTVNAIANKFHFTLKSKTVVVRNQPYLHRIVVKSIQVS